MLGPALAHRKGRDDSRQSPMTSVFAPVGHLLIQAALTARDTLLMKQVAADRGVIDRITEVASAIIAIALLTLTVVAIPVAFHSRRTYRRINHLLERVYDDITPIMNHAHSISDNVNYVTTSVRADVQKVNETINAANIRVQQALALTEQRMNEFNALLAVVQEEAEHLFLSTASTVRGVQHGAATFRDGGGMEFASVELDAADPADDFEFQEASDGYDSDPESTAPAPPAAAAPRLRPRPRGQRRA
jgi:uncharacterized protein YoxC